MTSPLALSPEFCETLYVHYGELLQDCKDQSVKPFLISAQNHYEHIHAQIVPFADVVKGIEFIINE